MEKNKWFRELLLVGVLVALLIIVVNPWHWTMSISLWWMFVSVMLVVFALFGALVWSETVRDERESWHRLIASRLAFLVGAGTLLVGIAVQSRQGQVDAWLPWTLGIMVFTKLAVAYYAHRKL